MKAQQNLDFDEILSVHGKHSEEYYTYDVYDYISLCKSEEDDNIITVDAVDNTCLNNSLLRYLHAYSTDPDGNEESQKLVSEYRTSISKLLCN